MRKWLLSIVGVALLLAAVPPSNQAIDYNTLIANQSGNFTYATTAPTGSNYLVTAARYRALVQTTSCPQATATGSQVIDWNFVISCASTHTASLQTQSVTGDYHTTTISATYNHTTGTFTCGGTIGSNGYDGNPITLPAGTVAPGTSTPLSINLTSITWSGSTSMTVALYNPSGTLEYSASLNTANGNFSHTYNTSGGSGGAWYWQFAQSGGAAGTCSGASGPSGGGYQVQWSGSVSWYQ